MARGKRKPPADETPPGGTNRPGAGETSGTTQPRRTATASAAVVADVLLGLEYLAGYLHLPERTARRLAGETGFPASVVPGVPASRRWPLAAVNAWALGASLGGLFTAETARAALDPVLAGDDPAAGTFLDVEVDLAARYRIGHTKAHEVPAQDGFPASVVPGMWRIPLPALRRWELAFSLQPTWEAFAPTPPPVVPPGPGQVGRPARSSQ